jgi:hypothetical protein
MGKVSGGGEGRGRRNRRQVGKKRVQRAKRTVGAPRRTGRKVGRDNSKHVGEVAEMEFMLEAARRRFGVSRPFANNQRYDVILDALRRLWRVQVKASGASHHAGFAVRACWRTTRKHMPYTSKQIDFLAVVIQGERMHGKRIWYLIPVRALGGRLTINLYPFGCRKDGEKRFEKYREAWRLLGKPKERER